MVPPPGAGRPPLPPSRARLRRGATVLCAGLLPLAWLAPSRGFSPEPSARAAAAPEGPGAAAGHGRRLVLGQLLPAVAAPLLLPTGASAKRPQEYTLDLKLAPPADAPKPKPKLKPEDVQQFVVITKPTRKDRSVYSFTLPTPDGSEWSFLPSMDNEDFTEASMKLLVWNGQPLNSKFKAERTAECLLSAGTQPFGNATSIWQQIDLLRKLEWEEGSGLLKDSGGNVDTADFVELEWSDKEPVWKKKFAKTHSWLRVVRNRVQTGNTTDVRIVFEVPEIYAEMLEPVWIKLRDSLVFLPLAPPPPAPR
mmetsp:Transcript_4679/g.17637  ORF Transcript_4679/g.17637 Transcript_4679/m.17637 type:complete len:308 (-) Transcript_4679:94-1017(-)